MSKPPFFKAGHPCHPAIADFSLPVTGYPALGVRIAGIHHARGANSLSLPRWMAGPGSGSGYALCTPYSGIRQYLWM